MIGGGPSLRGFNFDLLKSRVTVGVNDAAINLPWVTALFTADPTWVGNRRRQIGEFKGERYIAQTASRPRDIPGVVYLTKLRDSGLSVVPTAVRIGGTSGSAALNLAFLKKAKVIVLLGYDYGCNSRQDRHWHSTQNWGNPVNMGVWKLWAQLYSTLVPQLAAAGVTVINACPTSQIKAFPKITLDELAKVLRGGRHVLELFR